MIAHRRILAAGLATLTLALTSCTDTPRAKKVPEGKVLLQGSGASFPNPLYQKWASEFAKHQDNVEVEYKSVGSGKGIESFLEDTVDFGASDRAMDDKQAAKAKRGVLFVPTTAGMIALAYNPEGLPDTLRLPRDVYVDIFLGAIKNWSDPRIKTANPDFKFPDKQIAVVVRQDKSGTTFAFTNHLASISGAWKAGPAVGQIVQWPCAPLPAPGNEGVVALIKRTPYALGYAEYGQTKRLGLHMAELDNQAKRFVHPETSAGVKSLLEIEMPDNFRVFAPDPPGESSYPIITYTWILAHRRYGDAGKAEAIKHFLEWCLTEGQHHCEALGYVRLPQAVAQRALQEVRKIQ